MAVTRCDTRQPAGSSAAGTSWAATARRAPEGGCACLYSAVSGAITLCSSAVALALSRFGWLRAETRAGSVDASGFTPRQTATAEARRARLWPPPASPRRSSVHSPAQHSSARTPPTAPPAPHPPSPSPRSGLFPSSVRHLSPGPPRSLASAHDGRLLELLQGSVTSLPTVWTRAETRTDAILPAPSSSCSPRALGPRACTDILRATRSLCVTPRRDRDPLSTSEVHRRKVVGALRASPPRQRARGRRRPSPVPRESVTRIALFVLSS